MSDQRDNIGILGKNTRQREGKNDPGYTGHCTIDGKKYWINSWLKDGNSGKFFSLSFRPQQPKADSAPPSQPAPETQDDVPF